jgi:hypothetical protein
MREARHALHVSMRVCVCVCVCVHIYNKNKYIPAVLDTGTTCLVFVYVFFCTYIHKNTHIHARTLTYINMHTHTQKNNYIPAVLDTGTSCLVLPSNNLGGKLEDIPFKVFVKNFVTQVRALHAHTHVCMHVYMYVGMYNSSMYHSEYLLVKNL